jgi:hypothetical protein
VEILVQIRRPTRRRPATAVTGRGVATIGHGYGLVQKTSVMMARYMISGGFNPKINVGLGVGTVHFPSDGFPFSRKRVSVSGHTLMR